MRRRKKGDKPAITIPSYLCEMNEQERNLLEYLFIKFNHARRRAYALLQRGLSVAEAEKKLMKESGLNGRYVKDAIWLVKDLPPHITFGGKRNARDLARGKITREEWRELRSPIVYSRGERWEKGNLNMRVVQVNGELRLRINVPTYYGRKYIYPKLFIPEKYWRRFGRHIMEGQPYTVIIKRRNGKFYVFIQMELDPPKREGRRIMAIDTNAGYLDFAVLDKATMKLLAAGRINMHETLYAGKDKRKYVLCRTIRKVTNIAKHFDADVVVGRIKTRGFRGGRKANRKVHSMPHYQFRQRLKARLVLEGIRVLERSEAYTSVVGKHLGRLLGLDVHKGAAIAFAVKVLDYRLFRHLLREARAYEADGPRPSPSVAKVSGLTAPRQPSRGLACSDGPSTRPGGYAPTPGRGGLLAELAGRWKPRLHQRMISVKKV